MMAAVMAKGITILENAAQEPEVEDLAAALNSMGARIKGAGTDTITIEGIASLKPMNGHGVIPDRIETATFLCAGAITGGNVLVSNAKPEHVEAVTSKLAETGAEISFEDGGMRIRGPEKVRPADVRTMPFPGFPTDMQAQIMALLSVADGLSVISEMIFENRFMHVSELVRLGADILVEGRSAVVRGVKHLDGAPVMATDLRASASLVLAGLRARGSTEVSRIYHLDRGYESIEKKLKALGARIKRIKE
jgi:UDP-N-acetylglucosamine 1-carboxyvinyltransferase